MVGVLHVMVIRLRDYKTRVHGLSMIVLILKIGTRKIRIKEINKGKDIICPHVKTCLVMLRSPLGSLSNGDRANFGYVVP